MNEEMNNDSVSKCTTKIRENFMKEEISKKEVKTLYLSIYLWTKFVW